MIPSSPARRRLAGLPFGMACKQAVESVTEYLENAMPRQEAAQVRLHLERCAGCAVHYRQMEQTVHALSRLPATPPPQAVQQALLQLFRALYAT